MRPTASASAQSSRRDSGSSRCGSSRADRRRRCGVPVGCVGRQSPRGMSRRDSSTEKSRSRRAEQRKARHHDVIVGEIGERQSSIDQPPSQRDHAAGPSIGSGYLCGDSSRREAQRLHYQLRSLSLQIRKELEFVTKSLILYSTDGCHLCENAERLLRSMPELRRMTLDVVDIADDEALFARYGTTIPVLAASGAELAWPFNADDVLQLCPESINPARKRAAHCSIVIATDVFDGLAARFANVLGDPDQIRRFVATSFGRGVIVRGSRYGASVSISRRSSGICATRCSSSRPRRSSQIQPVIPMWQPSSR